jgi:hypothetical protein
MIKVRTTFPEKPGLPQLALNNPHTDMGSAMSEIVMGWRVCVSQKKSARWEVLDQNGKILFETVLEIK